MIDIQGDNTKNNTIKVNGKMTTANNINIETPLVELLKGADGFSPTITENAENTASVYKLDITNKTDTTTTPNLIPDALNEVFQAAQEFAEAAAASANSANDAAERAVKEADGINAGIEQINQEIDLVLEAMQNKADTDFSNTTMVRYPVAVSPKSLLPNWYIKYNDGWIEQGGLITSTAVSIQTVNFPIPMANTDYYRQAQYPGANSSTVNSVKIPTSNLATTSMGVIAVAKSGGGTGEAIVTAQNTVWQVKGYRE